MMKSCQFLSLLVASMATIHASGQSIVLAGGRFETSTNVSSWADLALDVAYMRETDSLQEKMDIYSNGRHATYVLANGTIKTRSLASLSREAFQDLKGDPMYSFYRHAFLELGVEVEGEQLGEFDNRPVAEYADTLVLDLFALNITNIESEAAIILNIWMYITHQLYEVMRACERNDANSVNDMNTALDIAAALWIGTGQLEGDNGSGNSLYNLAEIAGARFNQDRGETRANTLFIDSLDALKLGISFGTCSKDPAGYIEFRTIVRKQFGHMTIPLVQNLIHHMLQEASVEQSNFIELYALAVGPRVEVCKPAAFQGMLDLFVRNNFVANEQEEAIGLLRSIYSCLQVTCEEIGEYRSGELGSCSEQNQPSNFAGYLTTFLDVEPYSNFDRDILQIKVLTKARAYEAARDFYTNGYNVPIGKVFMSLKELATSSTRSDAGTQFSLFTSYFIDNDYADTLFSNALDSQTPFASATPEQTVELVTGCLRYLVMYMAILEKINGAVSLCRMGTANATDSSVVMVDQAVAYFVGSMEGSNVGGAIGGQLLYATSKDLCESFATCVQNDNSEVNAAMITALENLSNLLLLGECDRVAETIAADILPLLLIPLIQGTLNSAVELGSPDPSAGALGEAFMFSRAILPLINEANSQLADDLSANLGFNPAAPLPDGPNAVFQAIKMIIPAMQNPNLTAWCSSIGMYQGAGSFDYVCEDAAGPTTPAPSPPPTDPPPTAAPTNKISHEPSTSTFPTMVPSASIYPTKNPSPVAPSGLGFGRYEFTSDVTSIAALAFDVKDMMTSISIDDANTTYLNGGNYRVTLPNGSEQNITLASLSLMAETYMSQDPMFNIFRWALLDETAFNEGHSNSADADAAFANVVVDKALGVARNVQLAAETTVVMHVWMEIAHHLYESIRSCSRGDSDAPASIDRAVALWIGADQSEGSYNDGYLMYHITQQAAMQFGHPQGESPVNTHLLVLFTEAKTLAETCIDTPAVFLQLRVAVADILAQMSIPLLQRLMYFVFAGDANYAELYALAVVPQAIGCTESGYTILEQALIDSNGGLSSLSPQFFPEFKEFQKCLRITCDDIMDRDIADAMLKAEVLKMCYDPNDDTDFDLVGYNTTHDVYEYARLDLDILQIGIFMDTRAYNAALDYYLYGYNSRTKTSTRSLREIATSEDRNVVDIYNMFQRYFMSANYADDIIIDAINQNGIFSSASRNQLGEVVTRTLQCMVTYMFVLERIYTAVDECETSSAGLREWEEGMAVYAGSIEGVFRGGREAGDGFTLYSLAKEFCADFGTCEGSGDAQSNELLMEAFSDGRNLLFDRDCAGVEALIDEEFTTTLPIALVQGALFYAVEGDSIEAGSTRYEVASGYVLASSTLPLVDTVNSTSAATIASSMAFFDLTRNPVSKGSGAIFEAFTYALTGMNVNCQKIGNYTDRTVCNTVVVRPVVETPTELGEGIYTTTTYVEDRANIALDIVSIKRALDRGSTSLAKVLYQEGENSDIFNENGIKVGQRTIQGFSTAATLEMLNEPLFNIFRYALQDENGLFLGKSVRLYADSYVNAALDSAESRARTLAAEAMVVLNIWMYLVHELYETLERCKSGDIADKDGIHSIDEAVAYWVGDGQIVGESEQGHLLYALAEEMADHFQTVTNGVANVNTNILRLFNRAKVELSFPGACGENSNTFSNLYLVVNDIIVQMTIPLVQGLIHYLRTNAQEQVQLYAHAFVPLVAACDPDLFAMLRDKLMQLNYNVVDVEQIVASIRQSYDCLRIECSDVGQHFSETNSLCVDTDGATRLAGFVPNQDVRSYALLDLDILEASILMEMQAYDAVMELYTYGKHSIISGLNGEVTLSLAQLATTLERSVVPSFDSFVRYYDDSNYADTIIRQGLDRNQFTRASEVQRKEIVIKSMQYLILYIAILESMYNAIADCESSTAVSRLSDSGIGWDRAAALMIGSLEGTGGGSNGLSFFALAREQCQRFGTCTESGNAEVNELLLSLLYSGQGELQGGGCGALKRTTAEMQPLLLVPLIQGNLASAIENEKHPQGTQVASFASGYIFSRSVLPLVEDVSRSAASTINKNMDFQFDTEPVPDGAGVVYNAFLMVYSGLSVDCSLVGTCETVAVSGSRGSQAGLVVLIVLIVLFVLVVSGYLVLRRQRLRKTQEEIAFINKGGELNHDSDILAGGLNDAAVMESDEAYSPSVQRSAEVDSFSIT